MARLTSHVLCCVGPSPSSARLIHEAKRIADELHAPWAAATVEVTGAPPLAPRDRERLDAHLRLVETLGGEVHRLRGASVAETLLAHAHAHAIDHIVAGKPTHGRWRDRLRGSLLDALIRGSGSIEVHVLAPVTDERVPIAPDRRERTTWRAYALAIGAIGIVTALGLVADRALTLADLTMLYLIAIALVSLPGRGPSLVAASLAVVAYDFCFVPPRYTLAVSDVRQLLTFAVMFGCGLAISTLTVRLRRQERDAIVREHRTAALLAFTREVGSALTEPEVTAIAARHLGDEVETRDGFVEAIERQRDLAIARLRLAAEAREAALRATTEELRSSLLSAVSHDLRTPLAVITGAATTLRDRELEPAERDELLSSIVDDARRLERVLGNLLQLTRVETGFRPTCELVPADEVVGAALTRLESALGELAVDLDVEADLALWIDPVLFEQVLINLVENAIKHGAPPLAIAARRAGDTIELDVGDRGAGLPADASRLFDKFVRGATPAVPGVGLGLAVVRAIVTAHGGRVAALANPGGGALFRVTLPAPEPAA